MPVYNHIPKVEDDMQGATESVAGKGGLVPAPSAGDANRALMANGTWKKVVLISDDGATEAGKKINFDSDPEQCPVTIVVSEDGSLIVQPQHANPNYPNKTKKSWNNFLIGIGHTLYQAYECLVSGDSHTLGNENDASSCAYQCFAAGVDNTIINAQACGAIGWGLKINAVDSTYGKGADGITVVGKYNDYHEDSAFEVGTGTDDTTRRNAFRVTEDGTGYIATEMVVGCMDKTELCEQIRAQGRRLSVYRVASSGKSLIPGMMILNDGTNSAGEYCGGVQLSGIVQALETTAQGKAFYPVADLGCKLGRAGERWESIYAGTSTITTSDRNLKEDINPFTEEYEKLFFDLQPSTFKFKDRESKRTHTGFISQDVEKALEKNDLSALDFAGFCKDKKTKTVLDENGEEKEIPIEGEYIYSLRYEEFIALNTHMIQKLYAQVNEMQKEINNMKVEINRLKGEM